LSLGIGMGYHRLLTHRSYKSPKWIEYFLATCGTLALQGGPMFWVAAHRVNHQFSDKDGDPHTPRDGKWWSHIGWMLVGDATHCNIDQCSRYARDICKDRFLVWLSKYNYVPLIVLSIKWPHRAGRRRTLGNRSRSRPVHDTSVWQPR
jgi:stearoyl-CoA desaturase (delta-9 desaturase)